MCVVLALLAVRAACACCQPVCLPHDMPVVQSGAREHDGRRERERRRSRSRSPATRERGRERGHRERSPSPPRRSHAPRSPPRENEPIRLSRELAQLMSQLPPPHMCELGCWLGIESYGSCTCFAVLLCISLSLDQQWMGGSTHCPSLPSLRCTAGPPSPACTCADHPT